MGIRTRIFFITLSCLFIGISLSFIVAERDLSLKLQAQIETELSRQAKILRKSISGLIDSNELDILKAEVDEYASASDSRITIILKSGNVIVDSLPRFLIYPIIRWLNYGEFLIQRLFKKNLENNLFSVSGRQIPRLDNRQVANDKSNKARSLRGIVKIYNDNLCPFYS